MTSYDEYTLLGEITTYNEEKEELYTKLINDDAKKLIDNEEQKMSADFQTELSTLSDSDIIFNKFNDFFNREYGNHIELGNYFDDKIYDINKAIEEAKKKFDDIKEKKQIKSINSTTEKKILDNYYNKLTINNIYKHLLLVLICFLVLANLISILNNYGFIYNFTSNLIIILLLFLYIIYTLVIIYNKYPRNADDYNSFKFNLDNENMNRIAT
jgi:hypothetical protein